MGAGLPEAVQRHVRLRPLRRRRGRAVPRPRPARGEAALSRHFAGRRAGLRLRTEGPARPSLASPEPEPAGARGLSGARLRPRRQLHGRGRGQARRRPLPAGPPRRPDPAAGQMVGRRLRQPFGGGGEGARGGIGRPSPVGGALADGRGRPARRLPLRRGRQLGGGRPDGGSEPERGRDLLDRLYARPITTRAAGPPSSRRASRRAIAAGSSKRAISD